jgi:hypothetical protein
LLVDGAYRFVNASGVPVGVSVSVAVTGNPLKLVSATVPPTGSVTIPFTNRYVGLAGGITVNVTATAGGAGVSIGVDDCTSVIERTTV